MKGSEKMSIIEITSKIKELKELKAQIEMLQDEITAIEDSIKAEMLTRGVDEMQVDIYKVRYKTIKTSRFDSKAFKSTHEALYNQYTKQTEAKRFTVA